MAIAKARSTNPRELANQVVKAMDVSEWCSSVDIAGPGFINFKLSDRSILRTLSEVAAGETDFHAVATSPETVVIDFSSPNVAKPMHIGHIRSTILGECLARVFRLLGHKVITDNHIGDWGTQFGKLLVGWKNHLNKDALSSDSLSELERLYKFVDAQCKDTESVLEAARQELVKLQQGDSENLGIWEKMLALSKAQFETIYSRLDIHFDHTLGESFYNPWLQGIVDSLQEAGIASESEGAMAVFSDGSLPEKEDPFLKQKDGEWVPEPALVRKNDGGFNYTTTDLATIDYRLRLWSPDTIIYAVDERQASHFKKLFSVFSRWQSKAAENVELKHVGFGMILGADGRPFRTREGETVRLSDLLDEAEERAFAVVTEKNPDASESDRREIARCVGLGAIKYADLLPNRQSDYQFSWEKMLSFNGNTAPYLLYAYARIRSIFRKLNEDYSHQPEAFAKFSSPAESNLAKKLLNFGFIIESAAAECRPNYLCNYLYELAGDFTAFYEACPVLKADAAERPLRLALCELTGRVIKQGLHLLGIETVDKM